jgi:hypothetical protein
MASVRNRYKLYFSGDVFSERVPLERGIDTAEEQPLLFPVGINLVKLLALAQADSLFGEWEEDIVRFRIRQDVVQEPDAAERAVKMWSRVLNDNNAPSLFNSFMPIWDPDDPDILLEVYAAVKMTKEQCIAKYGFDPGKDEVWRVEHWTPTMYENKIDGRRIDAFSGVNPWGVIPFVYIPRIRTSSFYGDAITPDIIPAQDELNMRIADLGDAINYNSHPIRWAYNLPRAFDAENFPMGPEAMWDMGRVLGNSPPPEVKLLEADNPVPEPAFDYVKFIYDWSRTSAFAPPIAFGEDQGGGQRSGRTLEIRMWPLLRATRRSRGYMAGGLQRIMRIGAVILQQKKFDDVSQWTLNRTMDGTVIPDFWPLMPKDQTALVDEVVKLMSTSPPSISLETAQTLLGRGPAEVERILEMLENENLKEFFLAQEEQGTPSSSEDA